MTQPRRKLDLLSECNNQHVPPRQFTETFCRRCRNAECVNAGRSESLWTRRISTQEERLLLSPERADPTLERFRPLAAQLFVEAPPTAPLEVWGPARGEVAVHLAPVPSETTAGRQYDDAIARLRGGPDAPGPLNPTGEPETEPGPAGDPAPPTPPVPPVAPAATVPRAPFAGRTPNTAFPDAGIMVGGPDPSSAPSRVPEDPWTPRPAPANVVPRGARIRMGS